MTRFDDSQFEDDFQEDNQLDDLRNFLSQDGHTVDDQWHNGEFEDEEEFEDDEEFQDEDMREVHCQLASDANHLFELYPPINSHRLDQLVDRCLVAANQSGCDADSLADTETSGAEMQTHKRRSRRGIYQSVMELCVSLLLVVSFTILWSESGLKTIEQSIASGQRYQSSDASPSLNVNRMPRELLNASQPELEAIYDQMGYVSMSIEF